MQKQIVTIPWHFKQYAKVSLLYVKTTGRNISLFPTSLYLREWNPIPLKIYIYKCIIKKHIIYSRGIKYYTPSEEETMQKDCIEFMNAINWQLIAQEWTVIENNYDIGKGDLVFRSGKTYCVIECKRRTNTKVYEQAKFYGSSWKLHYAKNDDECVIYGIWTPKSQEVLGILYSESDALNLCKRRKIRD